MVVGDSSISVVMCHRSMHEHNLHSVSSQGIGGSLILGKIILFFFTVMYLITLCELFVSRKYDI